MTQKRMVRIKANPIFRLRWLLLLAATMVVAACAVKDIEIKTSLEIDAPPETVWEILTRFDEYGAWNPYHTAVLGDLAPNGPIDIHVVRPDGKALVVHAVIQQVSPNRQLVWGGGIPIIFEGMHVFKLTPTTGGGTLLEQNETFSGVIIPFLDLPPDVIEQGYRSVNEAVRQRASELR